MRAVVTGATGLLGRALAAKLVDDGWEVGALVRAGSESMVPAGVEIIAGDVTVPTSLPDAVRGREVVFHCASGVGDALPTRAMWLLNVEGTRNLIEASVAAGVPRFVYASSASVYGRRPGVYREDAAPVDPGSAYGRTKLAAEGIVAEADRDKRCRAVIVRPTTLYGPGDRHFLRRMVEVLVNRRAVLIDGGRGRLNLVYSDDAAQLMKQVAEAASPLPIYNVTGPDRVTWHQFIDQLSRALSVPPPRRDLSPRAAKAVAVCFEALAAVHLLQRPPLSRFVVELATGERVYPIDRASADLGFTPAIDMREGLARVLPELRARVSASDPR